MDGGPASERFERIGAGEGILSCGDGTGGLAFWFS